MIASSVPRFRVWTCTVLLLSILLVAGCQTDVRPADERARRARDASGPIVVGAAWPWQDMKSTLYKQGMEMAVNELNEGGGVLGRPLELVRKDDRASVDQARIVAQQFADNLDVVAVIGHLHSFTTLPAATIYDRAGLLLLAPTATDPDLTQKGFSLVFRSTFGNDAMGEALSSYVAEQGFQRIAVCYVANEYGRELANAFEDDVAKRGAEVVSRQGYSSAMQGTTSNLRRIAAEWKRSDVDAIFLAGEVPIAPMLIATARDMGVDTPFIGGDALRIPQVIQIGGDATEGLLVPYRFHPDDPTPNSRAFTGAFRKRHGVDPDAGAALGYDSIHLLAHAIRTAQSTVPEDVGAALRSTPWTGVEGPYAFDEDGNLIHGTVKLMKVANRQFVPLSPDAPDEAAPPRAGLSRSASTRPAS